VPIYRLGGGLKSSRFLRQIIRTALALYWDKLPEPLPEIIRRRYSLISLPEAIFNIHFPRDYPLLLKARIRLVFDEFFYLQLVLALKRYRYSQEKKGISFSPPGELVRRFYWGLDFELTSAQKRVIREITRDMLSSKPMSRLLQGDVGSGKTLVAIFAMLVAVESGYQTALMAPTEVLAEQHYFTFQNFLNKLNIPVSLLTASLKGQARVRALSQIKQGKTKIIIGTHALIQAEVKFHNLGLVIVDEQHKFGVTQRYQLRKKGLLPDMLVMTATPIPRTLTLTVYGDLELSLLDELPRGRAGIITRWVKEEDREQVYQFIKTRLLRGEQAYIVYPLIEESEKLLLKAACEMKEKLAKEVFPEFNVGLIHGRMTPQERVEIMEKFKAGEITLLVATTVIEVGLDIPNATIMVIEHAERFGLAQLHQLRGRIGRGRHQGYCFLLTSSKLSPEARERIKTIVSSTDGFEIAERDLKIRGPGELTGTRQHGLPSFKLANLGSDLRILKGARKAALELVKQEPSLKAYPLLRQKIIEEYKSGLKLVSIG
jgi:ATP-dependent DNA helicase RecG